MYSGSNEELEALCSIVIILWSDIDDEQSSERAGVNKMCARLNYVRWEYNNGCITVRTLCSAGVARV